MDLSLEKQLMSPQNMFFINKVHYFDYLVPCLHTFNPLSLSLKRVMTLAVNAITYRNMERRKSFKITNMIKIKGSEMRPFILIFRLNIVLRDSYQTDEIVMEIEEWKQNVPDDYVKSFIRVLLGVLETSIVFKKKLYYMNFPCAAVV